MATTIKFKENKYVSLPLLADKLGPVTLKQESSMDLNEDVTFQEFFR